MKQQCRHWQSFGRMKLSISLKSRCFTTGRTGRCEREGYSVQWQTSLIFAVLSLQLKKMVSKHLAPILDERCIAFRVHTVHVTLPVFMGSNACQLVGEVLCSKAADLHAAGELCLKLPVLASEERSKIPTLLALMSPL